MNNTPPSEELLQGPYGFIFHLLFCAKDLLYRINDNSNSSISIEYGIGLLSMLENVIDAERVMVPSGSSTRYPHHKAMIEEYLNELRTSIANLATKTDHAQLKNTLNSLGEGIKHAYLHNAKK